MRRASAFVTFASVVLLLPPVATGQAWVPEKGQGTLTVTFQDSFVKNHLFSNGERFDSGHIRSFILLQDVDFGITDKLAVDLSIPFVRSKYYGPRPHQLPVDNGNYHNNFQDFRLNLRYNLRAHPLMITPFVAIGVPTNDYIYFAHSAAGTRMREYSIGSNFGRGLGPFLPRGYVQALYAFIIPESVIGIRPYRSRVDWEIGYFVTKRCAIRMLGALQVGHAGLQVGTSSQDLGDFPVRKPTNLTWTHHDQISKISNLIIGGGATYAFTKSWSAFLALTTTVWGRNGHALWLGEVVGVSWTFRTPWAKPEAAAAPDSSENQPEVARASHARVPQHIH